MYTIWFQLNYFVHGVPACMEKVCILHILSIHVYHFSRLLQAFAGKHWADSVLAQCYPGVGIFLACARPCTYKHLVFQHGFLENVASHGCNGFTSLCSHPLLHVCSMFCRKQPTPFLPVCSHCSLWVWSHVGLLIMWVWILHDKC